MSANWPVDVIYLGETVCSRRHELRFDDWILIAQQLSEAGEEVVLATQTLIESESDLKALRKISENEIFIVEANEFGAVHLLSQAGVSFVAGPALNIYNPDTLALMATLGAIRWVPPVEIATRYAGCHAIATEYANRIICIWQITAGLFRSLFYGAPLQPAKR